MHFDPVPLTYISWSTDFVEVFWLLFFSAPWIAVSVKPCIVVLDLNFTFLLVILPDADAKSTSAAFLFAKCLFLLQISKMFKFVFTVV